jgi:hypothetical protein
MDDRTAKGRDETHESDATRSAPPSGEGTRSSRAAGGGMPSGTPRSSPSKPALTERERGERWPLG